MVQTPEFFISRHPYHQNATVSVNLPNTNASRTGGSVVHGVYRRDEHECHAGIDLDTGGRDRHDIGASDDKHMIGAAGDVIEAAVGNRKAEIGPIERDMVRQVGVRWRYRRTEIKAAGQPTAA
jgi:hypothetical protein